VRQLTYFIATTLDGRIAAPDGSADVFPVDPAYLAALAQDWGDAFPTAFHTAVGTQAPRTRFDTVVMGRGTFEPALAAGVSDPYAHLDTYVYSSSLDPAGLPEVHVVNADAIAHVRELKAGDGGGIWLCGGGRLSATLVGEIDRLVVKLNPVTVGQGRALFEGPFAPERWRLVSTRTFDLGVVLLEYVRADVEEPTNGLKRARGTFDVELRPAAPELGGAVGRFDFHKTFRGDLDAVGQGVMLTAGTPQRGSAGYVALESVTGRLDGRTGGFVLQQLGHLVEGAQTLTYQVVPGSGSDELADLTGTLNLTVDEDGTHSYVLEYRG
jgi:dihydrofolate reductase